MTEQREPSKREQDRAERRYAYWAPKFMQVTGRARAALVWDYVRARVGDLPKQRQDQVFETIADELVALVDRLTEGDLAQVRTTRTFARQRPVPESLHAQIRARAREA